ncbi:hypothetical protein ACFQL0_12855 [Haloplanus litoreus]
MLALCVAASMALGVGSYSSASADRSVSVAVVEDEEAYIGIPDSTLRCGRGQNALFYNRFPAPVTDGHVEVTVGDGDLVVKRDDGFVEYYAGQEFTVPIDENVTAGERFRLHLKPTNESAESITARIEVRGTGFSVSTTATRDVSCEKQVDRSSGSG